jgi:hypothetical protein
MTYYPLSAQVSPKDTLQVIQFTGTIQDNLSSHGIPFVNIYIKNTGRGTTSDYFGFFSMVARERDTVVFSAVGYKDEVAIVPSNLSNDNYYVVRKLDRDTVTLKAKTVRPFTKEQFADAFLNLKVKDDDYERAAKNLQQQQLEQIKSGMPMDGSLNFKNTMQQQYRAMYSAGQLPPANILNPIAWVQFFNALKKGKLKDPNKNR